MVAFLAVGRDMFVAQSAEIAGREFAVPALGFLKAENIRPMGGDETLDQRHAKTNGIDIPGRQFQEQGSTSHQTDSDFEVAQPCRFCKRCAGRGHTKSRPDSRRFEIFPKGGSCADNLLVRVVVALIRLIGDVKQRWIGLLRRIDIEQ